MARKDSPRAHAVWADVLSADSPFLFWLRLCGVSLALLALLAAVAALASARDIVMPVVAGIIFGLVLGPPIDRAANLGVPRPIAIGVPAIVLISALYVVIMQLAPVIEDVAALLPQAMWRISSIFESLRARYAWLPAPDASSAPSWLAPPPASGAPPAVDLAARTVAIVTPAVSQFLIFFFVLILFPPGRQEIRRSLAMKFKDRDDRLAILRLFSSVETRLANYFFIVTAINIALGAIVAVAFWLIGVPGALRWGMLAAVLNFLPIIGPLIMKGLLVGYGLLFGADFASGALPILIFLPLSLIEANLVTPKIVGNRITMNPLIVFIAVVFWTWLWGFAGAFLAMPLLAISSAALSEWQAYAAAPRPP